MVFMVMGPETTPSSACVCVAWLVMGPIGIVRHTHLVAVGDPPAAAATWNLLLRGDPLPYNLLAPLSSSCSLRGPTLRGPAVDRRLNAQREIKSVHQVSSRWSTTPNPPSLYSLLYEMLSGSLINLTSSQTNKKKYITFPVGCCWNLTGPPEWPKRRLLTSVSLFLHT